MVKNHQTRPPETFFQKRYFGTSVVVKNVFWCICAYFQTTKIFFFKKMFLNVWSGKKHVLMHSRILPDHQNLFFNKDVLNVISKKYLFWKKKFLVVWKYAQMHLNTFLTTPDSKNIFFDQKFLVVWKYTQMQQNRF